jgi:lipid-binding SYLF domain-containing protein
MIGLAMLVAVAGAGLPQGCSTAPKSESDKTSLVNDSNAALGRFKAADSSLQGELDRAAGYAIFPEVGKGGVGVGGAYGRGVVYQHGMKIGFADLSQATIGLQLGGQSYSQLILFQDQAALDRFKSGKLAFSANASAVAIKSGAAAAAAYTDGVKVLTQTVGGLMFEASIGGQQFTFQPN